MSVFYRAPPSDEPCVACACVALSSSCCDASPVLLLFMLIYLPVFRTCQDSLCRCQSVHAAVTSVLCRCQSVSDFSTRSTSSLFVCRRSDELAHHCHICRLHWGCMLWGPPDSAGLKGGGRGKSGMKGFMSDAGSGTDHLADGLEKLGKGGRSCVYPAVGQACRQEGLICPMRSTQIRFTTD